MFRDLEAQVAIVTTNTKLQQQLHEVMSTNSLVHIELVFSLFLFNIRYLERIVITTQRM